MAGQKTLLSMWAKKPSAASSSASSSTPAPSLKGTNSATQRAVQVKDAAPSRPAKAASPSSASTVRSAPLPNKRAAHSPVESTKKAKRDKERESMDNALSTPPVSVSPQQRPAKPAPAHSSPMTAPPSSRQASESPMKKSRSSLSKKAKAMVTSTQDDLDEDMEDIIGPTRRRTAQKRPAYFESDSEEQGNASDSEDAFEPKRSVKPARNGKKRKSSGADDDWLVDDGAIEQESDAASVSDAAVESEDEPVPRKRNNTNASSSKIAAASSSKGSGVQADAMQAFKMGSLGSASPANGRPSGMQKSSSMSHLTKAERRVLDERKKKAENEQAYSFLRDLRDKDGNRPGDAEYDPRTLYIPNGAWKDFTPFEKQFWEIKQKHWDTVLFFQKGKFYELYEEDALIGHREFDLKLTDRVKMKMVGVPEGSFEQFANKFLALGYKVGRVDQCETAVAKGMRVGEKSRGGGSEIVRRELRHVLTGGTIVDSACLPDDMGSYCVAIKETEAVPGQPIFGVCVLDAATAEFRLSEFEDDVSRTKLETMLRSLRLRELLHEKAGLSQRTLRILRNTLPSSCQVTMLKSGTEYLDHDAAMERLEQLFGSSADSHEAWPEAITSMLDRDTAMSALGGMLWYLEQLNLDQDLCSSKNFDIFDPLKNNGCLVLDAQSLSHLNVLSNEQGNDVGTLHKLLNRCVTPFGKRLFKIWLVAPLCERRALEARHDAVDDFLSSPDFQDVFDKAAKKLPDIERIMPRIHAGKCKPMDFTRVLTALSELDGLIERLLQETQHFSSTTIGSLLRGIPQVSPIAQRLQDMFALKDDGAFIPRTGVFQDFDDAQDAESAILDQLERELARAAKTVKLERRVVKWKHVGTNEIFQVEVPAKTAVPKEWSIVSQTKDSKRWYPPAVRQLVQELKESRETLLASLKLFHAQLFEAFSEDTAVFTAAVKGLAELDCLLSLSKASYALGSPACRPQFIDCETASVDFKDLRHPCMSTNTGLDFIANDVALGDRHEEVVILTGGNMAGKSTTARTAATAVILAQLGCRVPASSAVISPVDRIASRMGANDQIFRNNSTFMVEMLEASRIIRECTPRSLVIMDELGRGTSTFDGHAIAFAVLHHLVGRTRCLSFFLTHYTSLAHDFDAYPGVANKHMQVVVDDENREVVFTYRLVPGIAESSYGTQVAALAGVPHNICDRAMQVSKEFSEASKALQAQRTHSRISVALLADFAHLVKRISSDDTEDLSRQLGIIKAQARSLSLATASSSDLPKASEQSREVAAKAHDQRLHAQVPSSPNTPFQAGGWSSPQSNENRPSSPATSISGSSEPSSVAKVTSSPCHRTSSKKQPLAVRPQEQMVLDLGQRIQSTCRECEMSFDRSDVNDVALHTKYHERMTRGVEWSTKLVDAGEECGSVNIPPAIAKKLKAGSNEVQLLSYSLASNTNAMLNRKIEEVCKCVDEALGAARLADQARKEGKLLVGVSKSGRVLGAAVVGPCPPKSARRVAPHKDGKDAVFISDDPAEARSPPLAVHRIHVLHPARRAGLGVALLDAALAGAVYGMSAASIERMCGGRAGTTAFSQPTQAGRKLAEAWIKRGGSKASHLLICAESPA